MGGSPTKFTVIVPTRERGDTLAATLRTIVRQNYDNLEILVSDNFSQDGTDRVVRQITDSRIKYINTGRRVAMSHNWEFALSHVKDGWVTYLGDDDGLLPNALTTVDEIIRSTGCKSLSSKWHHYAWPNFSGVVKPNQLTVNVGQGFEICDAKAALQNALKGKITQLELPNIYIGGFAEYGTLQQCRDSSGRFFCSRTPDVYAAVALASSLDSYVYLRQPVSICGASSHSIGASQFGWSTNGTASAVFSSESVSMPFHEKLGEPTVRSVQLLIYEAYLQASHLHKNSVSVSFAEQLAISMANAGEETQSVESYCKQLADRDGLDFSSIKARKDELVLERDRKRPIAERIKAPLNGFKADEFQVEGDLLGLKDIFDAAIASQSLYFQSTDNATWRRKKILEHLSKKIYRRLPFLRPVGQTQ